MGENFTSTYEKLCCDINANLGSIVQSPTLPDSPVMTSLDWDSPPKSKKQSQPQVNAPFPPSLRRKEIQTLQSEDSQSDEPGASQYVSFTLI